MKEKRNKKDSTLLSLIIIVLLCGIVRIFGNKLNVVMYLCLLWHFKIILFAKKEEYLPIVLFNHTCSAVYDTIGFTYLFNFTIFIFTLKMLFNKSNISKKSFSLLVILFSYNIVLTVFNEYFTLNTILSTCSLFISYCFIIIISINTEIIDYNKCFIYFLNGFIFSAISAFSIPFSRWGFRIPSAYRFSGFLRDPNYYSIDALLLMNISLIKNNRIRLEYFFVLILGLLSISKMFLLLSILNILVFGLIKLFNNHKKSFYTILIVSLITPLIIIFLPKTNYYNMILDKYLYRNEVSNIFTGRDYLQKFYFSSLKSNPQLVTFGSSLDYRFLLNAGHNAGVRYVDFVAHNTYLDIILSWGIFGSIIYALLIYSIYENFIKRIIINVKNRNAIYYLFLTTIFFSLFALSYLNLDFFAIVIMLLIIYNPQIYNFLILKNGDFLK